MVEGTGNKGGGLTVTDVDTVARDANSNLSRLAFLTIMMEPTTGVELTVAPSEYTDPFSDLTAANDALTSCKL